MLIVLPFCFYREHLISLTSHWIQGWGLSSWWQSFSWLYSSCRVEGWRWRKGLHRPWSMRSGLWEQIITPTNSEEIQQLLRQNELFKKSCKYLQEWTVINSLFSSVEYPRVSFTWPAQVALSVVLKIQYRKHE